MRGVISASVLLILLSACQFTSDRDSRPIGQDIDRMVLLAEKMQYSYSDTALAIARSAYERSAKYEYQDGMARTSLLMGGILYQMGGLSQSLAKLNEAQKLYTLASDQLRQAEVNVMLGKVYQRSENYPQAFYYLHQAMQLYEAASDDHGKAVVYGNIGHLYEKTQAYDSALSFQKKALGFYTLVGDTLGLAGIHDNIGSIYEDLEDYGQAFDHFRIALFLNHALGNQTEAIVNLNNIGDIYRKQGNYGDALIYTDSALRLARLAHLDYQIKSASRDLSKIYRALGNTVKAFEYLEHGYELADDIFSEQIAREIAKTQGLYELEQKQQRILLLEKEQQFGRTLTMLSTAGALMFVLLGGFIFYQRKSKTDKVRKLLETEAELARAELENSQLNEQKLKTELENKLLKEEQLQQELELKSKSLTKSALHMIQKNEFLRMLRTKLKELKKGDEDSTAKKVKKLIKSIDLNFNMDEDWQEFETIFQQVHSIFFLRLKELYPDLSPSEVRLCAMIRLNLHSKDMSAIMGISQDSLRIARYRLRKRLGLERGANLYPFIINIG